MDKLVSMPASRQVDNAMRTLVTELSSWPYAGYAALKYPDQFHKMGRLDEVLQDVSDEELLTFTLADETNLGKLRIFADRYAQTSKRGEPHKALNALVAKAQKFNEDDRIEPKDPSEYIRAIQSGNAQRFISKYDGHKARVDSKTNDPYGRSAILIEDGSHR